jgi:hypothetical protein
MNRRHGADVYVLARIGARNWRILNKRYGPEDARHIVAHLRETPNAEVEVEWHCRTSLATTYRTPVDALDSICRQAYQTSSATRPIHIPSLPPPQPRRGLRSREEPT